MQHGARSPRGGRRDEPRRHRRRRRCSSLLFVAASSLFTVQQTEQVLITQFGEPIRVITRARACT